MEKYDIIFESENIYYIKLSELLLNNYLKMYTDSEVQRDLFKKEYTDEQILHWLKRQLSDENTCMFSMIEKKTHEFIGNIEIIRLYNNIGEIIISVTPDKQDKHYGTETLKEIIKYGYEKMKLNGFVLDVYKDNSKAIHCYEKVGFNIHGSERIENTIHMKHER